MARYVTWLLGFKKNKKQVNNTICATKEFVQIIIIALLGLESNKHKKI